MPQATGTLCACVLILSLSMSDRALAQAFVERPSLHADTVALGEAGTEARRHRTAMRTHADGSYTWTLRALDLLPQTLGAADPVRYARLMPGIQTIAMPRIRPRFAVTEPTALPIGSQTILTPLSDSTAGCSGRI